MRSTDVQLKVAGTRYSGWKSIRVRRSVEQFAGLFVLEVSETFPDPKLLAVSRIAVGEACEILIGDNPIITGYVDDVLPRYDAQTHEVAIEGRDRAADLIDCSAMRQGGEWKDRTLLQIAQDLAKPYQVEVRAEVDVGKAFRRFRLNYGETVYEALVRAGRMRGVLFMSDGLGGLVITRAGTARIPTKLERGQNILRAEATFSQRDRYQTYVVNGQQEGTSWTTAVEHSGPRAQVIDKQIGRHRVLVILAEDQVDIETCRQRGIWEKNTRVGGSQRAKLTVQGWAYEKDKLWEPNRLVSVKDEWLGLDEPRDLLIVSVAFLLDADGGTRTELELTPREAFDVLPLEEGKTKPW